MVKALPQSNSHVRLEISVETFAACCHLVNKHSASKVTEWLDKLSEEESLYAIGALSKEYYDFFPVERDSLKAALFKIYSELQKTLSEFERSFPQLIDVYLDLQRNVQEDQPWYWTSARKIVSAERGPDKLTRLQKALRMVSVNHEHDIKSFLEGRLIDLVGLAIDGHDTKLIHTYLDTLKGRRDEVAEILFVVNMTLKLQTAARYGTRSRRDSRETQLISELLAAIDAKDFRRVEKVARELGVSSSESSAPESSSADTDSVVQPWWRSVDPNWWREQE
jgi:hypothetical protein